jgi:hypothetical protein
MQLKPDTAIQRRTSLLVCGGNIHSEKSRLDTMKPAQILSGDPT